VEHLRAAGWVGRNWPHQRVKGKKRGPILKKKTEGGKSDVKKGGRRETKGRGVYGLYFRSPEGIGKRICPIRVGVASNEEKNNGAGEK